MVIPGNPFAQAKPLLRANPPARAQAGAGFRLVLTRTNERLDD